MQTLQSSTSMMEHHLGVTHAIHFAFFSILRGIHCNLVAHSIRVGEDTVFGFLLVLLSSL